MPRAPAQAPEALTPGRLSRRVAPERYALSLEIDPARESFRGTSRITAHTLDPRREIRLHARGLGVSSARATGAFGEARAKAEPRRSPGARGEDDELLLTFERPVEGVFELALDFEGRFDPALAGLYRVVDGGKAYAFTQFEPMDARRAFPCFDEPGWKTPFDVTVRTPEPNTVFGNMPIAKSESAGGWRTVRFVETPPLPTYLVALAVGPLDHVQVGRAGLVATAGRAAEGAFAARRAGELLGALEGYFGVPYPYPKLDLAAVPDFAAGAMENPGLVTFREELLLFDPRRSTLGDERRMTMVVAHELAHQWFGDYVTAAWWDDLWLNEGFATWMAPKVADRVAAGFSAVKATIRDKTEVMALDALPSARAVRQPVTSPSEALEAFDGVTYDKGAAVLGMLEATVGEAAFRRGIHAHLAAHAHGSATTDDFFRTLDAATGAPLSRVARSFVEQPGVPLVDVEVTCRGDGATLTLRQSALPGVAGGAARSGSWVIPVRIALDGAERVILLDAPSTDISLTACPKAVIPDLDDVGYYRYRLPARLEEPFAKARLTPRERAGFVSNQLALAQVGLLPPARLSLALTTAAEGRDRIALEALVDALEALHEALPASRWPSLATFAQGLLGPVVGELGWVDERRPLPAGMTTEDAAFVRRRASVFLGTLGQSTALVGAARERVRRLLAGDRIEPDDADVALAIAAFDGDATLHRALVERLARTTAPTERVRLVRALASFRDPALLRETLELTLTPAIKMQDLRYVFGAAFAVETRETTSRWVRERWDALATKIPSFALGRALAAAARSCSREAVESDRAFLQGKTRDLEGGDREIAVALERSQRCAAFAPLVQGLAL